MEHTYGRLKGRWHCLLKRLHVDISPIPEIVASCVLHNICEIHGDSFNNDWLEGVEMKNNNSTANTRTPCNSDGECQESTDALF